MSEEKKEAAPKKKKGGMKVIVLAVIAVLFIGGGFFVLKSKDGRGKKTVHKLELSDKDTDLDEFLTNTENPNVYVRAKITVPADTDKAALEQAALADERVQALIAGKTYKVIVVPGKLVNIVLGK